MKKLITNINGGMPQLLNNHRWFQAGLEESIASICKGFLNSSQAIKLWGARVIIETGGVTVSEGAIYIDNEICMVPQHNLPGGLFGGDYYWDKEETFDPSGLLLFQNGQEYNVYANYIVKLNYGDIPSDGVALDIPELDEIINPPTLSATNFIDSTYAVEVSGSDSVRVSKYRNTVWFTGYILIGDPNSEGTIQDLVFATLDSSFRSTKELFISVTVIDYNSQEYIPCFLRILPNGEMMLRAKSGTFVSQNSYYLHLSGISFISS